VGAARSASRLITWRWCSQPAVYPGGRFAPKRAAAYPYPFVLCRTELPKIIEIVPVTGIVACAPKHPEVSLAVRPSERIDTAPRDVSSGRNPQGAVHAGLVAKRLRRGRTVQSAAAAHPCPHVRGRVELPKVIENAPYATCSVSLSSKEPEITISVRPCRFRHSPTGEVSSSGLPQNAVGSIDGEAIEIAVAAHPGPLVD
jgi:hypothetical protein